MGKVPHLHIELLKFDFKEVIETIEGGLIALNQTASRLEAAQSVDIERANWLDDILTANISRDSNVSSYVGGSSGPRNLTDFQLEREMSQRLTQICASIPTRKAKRTDAIRALWPRFLKSKNAAERVWSAADTGHWSLGGNPRSDALISFAEIILLLEQKTQTNSKY